MIVTIHRPAWSAPIGLFRYLCAEIDTRHFRIFDLDKTLEFDDILYYGHIYIDRPTDSYKEIHTYSHIYRHTVSL